MNLRPFDRRLPAIICVLILLGATGLLSAWAADAKDPFEVPDGKPPALMGFINKMKKLQPPRNDSAEEKKAFLIKSHTAIVAAADKILATSPMGKQLVLVVQAKADALVVLDQAGDSSAKKQLGDLADQFKDDKVSEVVKVVQPFIGMNAKPVVLGSKEPAGPSWAELKPKLAAAPEDRTLAQEALKIVSEMERSTTTELAIQACNELKAILAKSKDPQIAAAAGQFDGVVRRLSLPGKPIEIRGNLVDGTPVNVSALKGKVVLVDFWATWCGPCKAELPNVKTNYEKYHSKGFEVVGVSVDQDKAALLKFIADEKLPWPIMFGDRGPGMAEYYGVNGIPCAILTNQKGEVVSLNARGENLTRALEQMLGK